MNLPTETDDFETERNELSESIGWEGDRTRAKNFQKFSVSIKMAQNLRKDA